MIAEPIDRAALRRILHMDMDAFFAAVEERRRPELRGKPVVIGGSGDPHTRGVVSTANYEARKYGVHSALPLRTAYKLCPQAVFLPVDYDEYSRVSAIIKGVLRLVSPVMEDMGIDEAYLDITAIPGTSEEIAAEIKRRVREETGLTCSIGIAPNKLLAKISSDLQKPDGLTIISEGDVERKIWPLAVRKLYGVGPKTEAHLHGIGIKTIGDLAALAVERLVEEFGESYGAYLYDASRGVDDSPLVTHWEPKSTSRETTFEHDVIDWQVLAKTLVALVKESVQDIRERGYRCRNVTVKVRYAGFETHTRALTLPDFSDDEMAIRKAAFDCLGRFDNLKRRRVRLIGVRLARLEKGAT
jgi:DNA polymerase-4